MTEDQPRILVVGYNAFDITIPAGPQIAPDSKLEVPGIGIQGGGPGATAAVALARWGNRVSLATPLADDLPGQLQRRELETAGVNLDFSPVLAGHESAKAVILVDAQKQERSIYWSRGSLPHLTEDQVHSRWLEDFDLLYLDGHEPQAGLKLARAARKLDLPVVLDAGSVRAHSDDLVGLCTDVISSEKFAPELTGQDDPALALTELKAMGPERVGMTFGAGGMLAIVSGKIRALPAFDLPVVDTTGAGDVFHAGYAHALVRGWEYSRCLRFGAAVAGLKCGDWGGRKGIPTLTQALQVMESCPVKPLASCLSIWGP